MATVAGIHASAVIDPSARIGDGVSIGEISHHHDEVRTINRNWIATIDYAVNDSWDVSAGIPVFDRDHLHIHNHDGERIPESWDFTELGDVQVVGRYQRHSEDTAKPSLSLYGLNFGAKLPTGERDVSNDEGERAERSAM